MKNALLLHGTSGDHNDNWLPWLERELKGRGYRVWNPDLPGANKPNIQRYNEFILPRWKFDKDSIIIGHSSGAVAILGILQNLQKNVVIKRALLVAGFTDNLQWDALDDLFLVPFDWKRIKKKAKDVVLFHSDNDPYVPLNHGKKLEVNLDAKLVFLPGQFHFSVSSGGDRFKQLPELLPYL